MEDIHIKTFIDNFEALISYFEKNVVALSKKGYLGKKDLWNMHNELVYKQPRVTENTDYRYHFQINMHYAIAFKLGILEINNSEVIVTSKYEEFLKLNDKEKYFTLFKTLFVECCFNDIFPNRKVFSDGNSIFCNDVQLIIGILCNSTANKTQIFQRTEMFHYEVFVLKELGFWTFNIDENNNFSTYCYQLLDFTPTSFGVEMAKIMYQKRKILDWNKSVQRFYQEKEIDSEYEEAFKEVFDDDIQNILGVKEKQVIRNCNYILRIKSQYQKAYRDIKISCTATLDDLHLYIQKVFDFDNDHLYAFFMNNKKWRDNEAYGHPEFDDYSSADGVSLGELELYKGKTFMYLFDFGDEWVFTISVKDIITEELIKKPITLKKVGKLVQYDYWY